MTEPRTRTVGLLLAGGQSRRMAPAFDGAASGDKGLLDLAGRPMIAHVIERLAPQVGRMVINANGDPARFASYGLPVVADTIGGFAGPLAGILAGLRWAAQNAPGVTHIASVSTDAPLVPVDLVERLHAALNNPLSPSRPRRERGEGWGEGQQRALVQAAAPHRHVEDTPPACPLPIEGDGERGFKIAIAQSGGELHPVIGLWPVALADDLEAALASGTRKVLAWTDKHGTVPVEFPFLSVHGQSVDPFFNANTPEDLATARRLLAT